MNEGFRLSAATGLHKGDRAYQQDQVALLQHPRVPGCLLAVVADGMGGRSGGRKASDQVMLTARQLFERFDPRRDEAGALMQQLAREAHLVIGLTAIAAEEEPHSTLAAFVIHPAGDCHWVHAGDSRIYHFRGAQLVKRTLDHSWVQDLVARGEITEDEALDHPQSHLLTGCLGGSGQPPADLHTIARLRPGDTLLACSDGLWQYLSTQELGAAVAALPPRNAVATLIETARQRARGGGDNLCVVIVQVTPLDTADRDSDSA